MPIIENKRADPLDSAIEIRSSAIFEMLISMQGIIRSPKLQGLREAAIARLGEGFLREIERLHGIVGIDAPFAELAADFTARDDVDGFIRYVSDLPAREFVFYVLSRFFPLDAIPENPNASAIEELIDVHDDADHTRGVYPDLAWADDVEHLRRDLCELWRRYWNEFFRERIPDLEPLWRRSIDEFHQILDESGGSGLMMHITGHPRPLDPMYTPHIPITRIEFFPVVNTFRRLIGFQGYGSMQVCVDCSKSKEREVQLESYRQRSLALCKALGDENRVRVLKMIAEHPYRNVNGSGIAKLLRLSQSVVSRHLTQLKQVGAIEEHTEDNRSLTYSIQIERIRAFCREIEEFLTE